MSLETFLLTDKSIDAGPGVRRVSSRAALKKAVGSKHGASNWIAEPTLLSWLHGVSVQTKHDSLLLLDRPRRTQAPILQARFSKVWAPDDGLSFLPKDELLEVIVSESPGDLFIGGVVDQDERAVLLLRGNLEVVEASFDDFHPSGVATPDFTKFGVVEYGTAVKLGEYVVTAESILYVHDPKYRKRAKERRLKLDKSFGGSLRRLRLLRGLSQADFEPEVSAKQIARLETGRTEKPRDETLKVLAKKLRVKPSEILSY